MTAYKRVLIKISGEALAAEKKTGYDFSFVTTVCEQVKRCVEAGAQVGIVVGGGNFWRGVKDGDGKIERVSADRMGMLATAMNGLALADVFAQCGVRAKLLTAVDIQGVGERYDTKKGDRISRERHGRDLRLRHGHALLLHGYGGGAARGGDPRRRDPACQEHRRRIQ